jgi:Ala-tRNA(Pro) deacylase
MTPLRICLDYLDSVGVCYTHVSDAAESAANGVAETVVLKGDAQYMLVVIPAESYVEIGKVRAVVGAGNLRFATEHEMAALFPFGEVEWVPPLGGLAGGVPVYLDREIADRESVAFNACTSHDLIHMRTADFQRIAPTVIGSFSATDYKKEFSRALLAKGAGA